MEEGSTRHPTGYGENISVLLLAGLLGKYLGGLVGDPNLTELIMGGTMMGGKIAQTFFANHYGAPLSHAVGANAMKGAKLGVILLALWLPTGCSLAITGQGAYANLGASTIRTCSEVESGALQDDCTVVNGAPISLAAGSIIGGLLQMAARTVGASYGVPVAAPE